MAHDKLKKMASKALKGKSGRKLLFSGMTSKVGKAGSNFEASSRDLHDRREMPNTPHESYRGVKIVHPAKSRGEAMKNLLKGHGIK